MDEGNMSVAEKREKRRKKPAKRKIHGWVRAAVQVFFFLLMPSAYTSAFAGIKYIFAQIGLAEPVKPEMFLIVLIVLCVFTIVFGRFFCGFACAFGSLGDFFRWITLSLCKKIKKKPPKLPEKAGRIFSLGKYAVLAVVIVLCYKGLFQNVQSASPWTVFSLIHARNFALSGYIPGIILLLLIIAGMCLEDRFFCRFLCPMGAVFSILPVPGLFGLVRDRENCIKNCSACTRTCPSNIELPETGKYEIRGDCFQCQKCTDTCPKGNIHTGIRKLKGNEIWFTVLRAALLFGILKYIGL